MDGIEILGGRPLHGKIAIQGSKNAILPVIAGAVLHKGVSVLHNCPDILDVTYMAEILKELGCRICYEGRTLSIDATNLREWEVSEKYAVRLRSSIILLGSLLGRMKQAKLSYPGGCMIGERPIDLHLEALRKMDAEVREDEGFVYAETKGLRGAEITFDMPSVGATENVILGSVLADGVTILNGAAREPEIVELCLFLNGKGARISGMGSGIIRIEGVKRLVDSEYTMCPDRIVAGTYLLAAAGTRGSIVIERCLESQLAALLEVLTGIGGVLKRDSQYLYLDASEACHAVSFVETSPYPGFPTDLQSQLMAVLCRAEGRSRIRENLFETRFQAAGQFQKLGAQIEISGKDAVINGVQELNGGEVEAMDLRGGAALVIAGLMANGVTRVKNRHFIDRGYENICRDLNALGASVHLMEDAL